MGVGVRSLPGCSDGGKGLGHGSPRAGGQVGPLFGPLWTHQGFFATAEPLKR